VSDDAQNLVTVQRARRWSRPREILHKHRIEKLLVVDRRGKLWYDTVKIS